MDERNPDLPQPSPNERGHYEGERVRSNNDQRDEMSQERDPSHPSGWSPKRPYDKPREDGRVRDDGAHQRDRIRADVAGHLRRHQGR
jgi:hypothetical protein